MDDSKNSLEDAVSESEEIQSLYDNALDLDWKGQSKKINGDHMEADKYFKEAFKLFKQASDLGIMEATARIGGMYLFGYGVEQNTETAIAYFTKSKSWTTIARMYYEGMQCEKNAEKALKYYLMAAEEGDSGAMNMAGILYAGWSDERFSAHLETTDYQKAFYWFKKAAELKHVSGMVNLAYLFYNGEGTSRNVEAARKLFLEAAELDNKRPFGPATNAMGMLAKIYRDKSDMQEGLIWFKKAVEQDDFCVTFDKDEFFDFYLLDAESGSVKSMIALGHLEHMRHNAAASDAWYKRAFDWDNLENIYDVESVRQIANGYLEGNSFIPVAQDELEAIRWFKRAVNVFDDIKSMKILSDMFSKMSEEYSERYKKAKEDKYGFLSDYPFV